MSGWPYLHAYAASFLFGTLNSECDFHCGLVLTQAVLKDTIKNYQFQMKCTIAISLVKYEHQDVERGQMGHDRIYLLMLFPLSGVIWV